MLRTYPLSVELNLFLTILAFIAETEIHRRATLQGKYGFKN